MRRQDKKLFMWASHAISAGATGSGAGHASGFRLGGGIGLSAFGWLGQELDVSGRSRSTLQRDPELS